MKRILLSIALIAMSVSLFAEGLPMMAGLNLGLSPAWGGASWTNDVQYTIASDARYNFGIGAFFDIKYVRIDVAYAFSLGAIQTGTYKAGTANTITSTNSNTQVYVNIGILGKYPIDVASGIAIWPAVGLEYSMKLYDGETNVNEITNDYDNNNHLWLNLGVGADFKIAENIYIVPSVLYGIDLTPSPFKDTDKDPYSLGKSFADVKWAPWAQKLTINLGVAYKF